MEHTLVKSLYTIRQEVVMTALLSETMQVGAMGIRFALEAGQSDGRATAFECHVPAGARMPAPHSHAAA